MGISPCCTLDLRLVYIDTVDLSSEIGKAGGTDQTDIADPDDSDTHDGLLR